MMGRALERLPSVPAGNVLAMAGLDACILKSATLASSPCCMPLAPMIFQVRRLLVIRRHPWDPGARARARACLCCPRCCMLGPLQQRPPPNLLHRRGTYQLCCAA
jgi:hypothetical protein